MVVARSLNIENKYVLTCDRKLPEAEQTVFYFRIPNLDEQYALISDEVEYLQGAGGEVRTKMKLNKESEVHVLVNCITRIENLRDQAGDKITWPEDEVGRKRVLSQLSGQHRVEVFEAIRSGSSLSEADVKNSRPLSKSR